MAAAPGYSDTFGALKKHVDDEDKQNCQNDSFETPRGMTVINESGLYSLALSCATGVAKSLGYAKPQKEVRDHCKGTVERRTNDSLGRQQTMKFITEGDIYRLAAKSEPQGFAPGYLRIH